MIIFKYKHTDNYFDDVAFYSFGADDKKIKEKKYALDVDGFVFLYVSTGAGSVAINGKSFPVKENDLLLIKPESKVIVNCSENNIKYYYIDFGGRKARSILASLNLLDKIYILRQYDKDIEDAFLSAGEFCKEENNFTECGICSCLFMIFYKISSHVKINSDRSFYSNQYINKVMGYINEHYAEQIALEEISAFVGLNSHYLSNLFKNVVHVTVKDYIINVRIRNACRLLGNENLSVTDVSSMVGYNDPIYFSKEFKKRMKVSPSLYAKRTHLNKI